jgi:site-specific DNA-cytosine methylase
VGRVANGIPNRSHRLKALGNAVVPPLVAEIGRIVMEFDQRPC